MTRAEAKEIPGKIRRKLLEIVYSSVERKSCSRARVFLPKIGVSSGEISNSLGEIGKSPQETHKRTDDLGISSPDLGIPSRELPIFLFHPAQSSPLQKSLSSHLFIDEDSLLKEEWEALQTFDAVVEDVLAQTPGDLPSIEDWVLTPQSEQLRQAAQTALLVFEPRQP